jgi:hypothetical protein
MSVLCRVISKCQEVALSEICCLVSVGCPLWLEVGSVSYLKPRFRSWSQSYFTTQSVSMFWCRAPLWDLRPYITSCRNVAVWKLRSCFCGALCLTKRIGLQFSVQSLNGPSHAEPVTILYCLIWDAPNVEGQVSGFVSPRNRVAQLYPRAPGHHDLMCKLLDFWTSVQVKTVSPSELFPYPKILFAYYSFPS